jgi:hypothetical protein
MPTFPCPDFTAIEKSGGIAKYYVLSTEIVFGLNLVLKHCLEFSEYIKAFHF